jgi:ribonuclease HII
VKKKTKDNTPPVDWLFYENAAAANGCKLICGVDEAGRGPLAGAVFAAAVILPPNTIIEGVNDSKKLSEKNRERLFDIICEKALAYSVASVSEAVIDEINILQATYRAMSQAVSGLSVVPDFVLIDGNKIPPRIDIPAEAVVGGDAKSASIACASILAKVSRDRYMLSLAERYPQYCFERHKGYGTKLHIEKLREFGVSEIHRRSFLTKIEGVQL